MRLFGLTPDQVLARGAVGAAPSLAFSMAYAALSFGLVSTLAYTVFAFELIRGEPLMYAAIAAIYIGLTGAALSRLVLGAGSRPRFALLFAVAFMLYAVAWCAFWFGLRGKLRADLWGSVVALAALAFVIQRSFGRKGGFLEALAVLFTFHTLGYFLGDVLHVVIRGPIGRLLWGTAHGLGFGAGIGYLLFHAQAPLKSRLTTAPER